MSLFPDSQLPNKVHLIAYPNSLGKDLREMKYVLDTYLKKYIHGIHILPFYPSSSDGGFAPLTHEEIDPAWGTWEDIKAIANDYYLTADLVVNHISSQSEYFQDYVEHSSDSRYKDFFIPMERFCSEEDGTCADIGLEKIYRPYPSSPFREYARADGSKVKLWSTFSEDQVDLNMDNPEVREMYVRYIKGLSDHGVKMLRLDAIGYAIKRLGSDCFMIPETYELIRSITDIANEHGIETLAEVHFDYQTQMKISESGASDWTYDFALSPLLIHGLFKGTSERIKNWIKIRPHKQVTVLDTHDGIGIVDAKGLLSEEEIAETTNLLHLNGGNIVHRASGTSAKNVDVYQINSTYYSALGANDDAYIAARIVQFFVPGVPQVYCVGLFDGQNDIQGFELTGNGRDVNRHRYTIEEIERDLEIPPTKRLLKLIDFRNTYPAFNGTFTLLHSKNHILRLRFDLDDLYCEAIVNLKTYANSVEYVDTASKEKEVTSF